MSKFHVNQIETHLRDLYSMTHWNESLDAPANLSRLLALHAVHLVLGSESGNDRTIEITDGGDDRGIDAIGIDPTAKLVILVQSKWRQGGTGSIQLGDVLKFLQGVKSLLGMRASDEPVHATPEARLAVRELLRTPGARIRLVITTTASEPMASAVSSPINELLDQLNDLEGIEPLATHVYLAQAELFHSITAQSRASVDIDLQMLDWGRAAEPHKIYYGRVSASEIAGWYEANGAELFTENIRVVIPRSDINEGILQTIKDEPQQFLYYNNGIIILAESIEIGPGGAINRDVGYFKLSGASIVNGAQTVSTIGAVRRTDFARNLGSAFVLVRCIEVPKADEDLGRRITRFANTQNEVSSQDFAFLDPEQHRLVKELQVLGYEYILRSAESHRSDDPAKIIELRQAAVALACASSNVAHVVIAKREVSLLFSNQSFYKSLFNPTTDPLHLARAVSIMRIVDGVLIKVSRESDGLTAGIAVHGNRVIAHMIMQALGDSFLSDPSGPLDLIINILPDLVIKCVTMLEAVFPSNAYPGNVFKNQTRVASLLQKVKIDVNI